MIEDIKENEDLYNHFVKECIRDLKSQKLCYVYNREQLEEVRKRYKGETIVEENECGYTIKIKRNRRDEK